MTAIENRGPVNSDKASAIGASNPLPIRSGGSSPGNITNTADVSKSYSAGSQPTDAEIQSFLQAFAQNKGVYNLISILNESLKSIFRDMRETETKIRIDGYIKQFDIALEKRDEIIKTAAEVKELGLRKADMKRNMGIAQISLSVLGNLSGGSGAGGGDTSGIVSGAFQIVEAKMDKLQIEIDDMKSLLEAINTELDAKSSFAKQEADLAGSHISMLDNLNSTFMSLINDLHSNHNGTISSMAKGMV